MKDWDRDCLRLAPAARRARVARRAVDEFVRSTAFAEFVLKPRKEQPKKSKNPKAVAACYAPLAVLGGELARKIGAKSLLLRLTEPVANKMWWRHGPGVKNAAARQRMNVPPEWYADIPLILRMATPRRNDRGRWQFDHAGMKRRLVLDLDERGNPVMITYHRKSARGK